MTKLSKVAALRLGGRERWPCRLEPGLHMTEGDGAALFSTVHPEPAPPRGLLARCVWAVKRWWLLHFGDVSPDALETVEIRLKNPLD